MAHPTSMVMVEDLLLPDDGGRDYPTVLEFDPLTEDDALEEAQLLDVRFDALRSTAGLLFDLRTAVQFGEANTGVLILRGVRTLTWVAEPRDTALTAWTVSGSVVRDTDLLFGLELGLWMGALLTLSAEHAAFVAGDVPGLKHIPDYVNDKDCTIRAQLASWRSPFEPMCAVFLDPAKLP